MSDTLRNLDDIASHYTFFETDQVLTPAQLNSVSEYLGDQERLTRVALLGVGIACGLWASLDGTDVLVSHGVGTTTDGDLVFLPGQTRYKRYRPYERTAPIYAPFRRGADVILAYELVADGESDSQARKLADFDGNEDVDLAAMAAVLYVESYQRDDDLCSGTDCDNRGKEWMHSLKVLLVERASAAALAGALDTPDGAARTPLDPVVVARALLRGTLTSEAGLAAVYRTACGKIHDQLVKAFAALWQPCKGFLGDLADDDPAPRWRKALEKIRDEAQDRRIQYYYDFLKDLAETYNAFRDTLFGDTAVCCPDLDAFPKHLVLGALDPKLRSSRERTGFYPSPMVSAAFEQRARARFLIRKIDALIGAFTLPLEAPGIRVTPSVFEPRRHARRAIPWYYDALRVFAVWNHELTTRGMERYNYSYNASVYGAQGAAAKPLEAELDAFDFFRVEGHIGREGGFVQATLEQLIQDNNLPIALEMVRLDKPPKGWRPPRVDLGLDRFHHLLRAEMLTQLDEADRFGEVFAKGVKDALGKAISNDDNDNVPLDKVADDRKGALSRPVKAAAKKIGGDKYDPSWKDDFDDAVDEAADFQRAFTSVTKKDSVSPLDQLIAGQPARLLNWWDVMTDDAADKDAERAQLSAFLKQHPGLEHYAGVLRGGTFVLVCDAQNTVIADFMLPYNCCEPRFQPPKLPTLTIPPRRPAVFEKPVRLVPFPDKFRFEKFRTDFLTNVQKDLDLQKKYFDGLKDSIGIFAGTKGGAAVAPGGVTVPGSGVMQPGGGLTTFPGGTAGGVTQPGFTDTVLGMHTLSTTLNAQVVDTIRTQLLNPELEAGTRNTLEKQLETAETQLATSIVAVTDYVAGAKLDVKTGTEGAAAIAVAAASLGKVSNIEALSTVEKGLTGVGKKTGTAPAMQVVIGSMLGGRML